MAESFVGILGLEVYFPSTYVSQEDLETQNNCKGKYTVGLGQDAMAFCSDREDINSIALTVVNNLLIKYSIPMTEIGRLEIGTETLLDKSKSTKTVLMDLFAQTGNTDIEGVTVVNACYGGTAALLNALCWVDNSVWDGRYAIVVAADIAVYADGPARPTGGCGAVAMLVGRNAPLPIILRTRTCHSTHVWDFFKPKMDSEYPEVNGALSQTCYLQALDDCYKRFLAKQSKFPGSSSFGLNSIDEFLFHSPYNKLVQKSFNRLVYLDMLAEKLPNHDIQKWLAVPPEETYDDKELETKLKSISGPLYNAKVFDGCVLSKQIGNTYTASLYMNLAQLVSLKGDSLSNKRIAMFSYGSGAMASLFEITPRDTNSEFTLKRMQASLNIAARLLDRQKMTPINLTEALHIREETHGGVPYYPVGTIEGLYPGTFYLEQISATYERKYIQKPLLNSKRIEVPMFVIRPSPKTTEIVPEDDDDFDIGGVTIDSETTLLKTSRSMSSNALKKSRSGSLNLDVSGRVGLPRSQTMVWASGKLIVKVVVTGIAAALPGRDKQMIVKNGDISNIQRIINGENFISEIPEAVKLAMLEKNVIETVKTSDGKLLKRCLVSTSENINLCAAIGKFDLTEYGVSESIASTMDYSVQVAIMAGLEALKHSGIISGVGPDGWVLPSSMQDTTGVVFATSFPALDTAIAEVSKFYESKALHSHRIPEIISILRVKLSSRYESGVLSDEVESALESLLTETSKLIDDNETNTKLYEFDRKFLFRVLVLGNAQLAQLIKARGPNMQTNAACAGATQAIALAYDMIQVGRAERVIVIAGDNASSDTLMPWLGNGFRALGAATTCADVKCAAVPFNEFRTGMILGSGGIGMILESEDGARRRFALEQYGSQMTTHGVVNGSDIPRKLRTSPFCCRLLGTLISNSAYHGASMDKNHIASEMERFISSIEKEQLISRKDIAQQGVYFSHETSTHASATSSCAFNELYGLRKTFGEDFKHLLILNTKGFTGHPMGVSFEDVVAAEVLMTGLVPPVANFTNSDPALGEDLKISQGGKYDCKYAIRFAAGFGSQVALALYGRADVL